MIRNLSIHGFRGFSEKKNIEFAVPERGKCGLTILVGPNNSGKSTILEAISLFSRNSERTLVEGVRNAATNKVATFELETSNGNHATLSNGRGSELLLAAEDADTIYREAAILKVPSRRSIPVYMNGSGQEISTAFNAHLKVSRITNPSDIDAALMKILEQPEKKQKLVDLIKHITGYELDWTTESEGTGNKYFKFLFSSGDHSLEGLGEGLISLIIILMPFVEGLFPTVVIDEPELSLHPALQKRLFAKLIEFSKNHQIIISTHSPYFVDISLALQGALLYRVYKQNMGPINVNSLKVESVRALKRAFEDVHKPHTFGPQMREMLFLEDKIIVAEGQEDVVAFSRASTQLAIPFEGDFFGWGAGGAQTLRPICRLLSDLGYQKVVGIYDGDQRTELEKAKQEFPQYYFLMLPTSDIRDKDAQPARREVVGMLKSNLELKDEYRDKMADIILTINSQLNPD